MSIKPSFAEKLRTIKDKPDISIDDPILSDDTSEDDFKEAKYVFQCLQKKCCCSRAHISGVDLDSTTVSTNTIDLKTIEEHSSQESHCSSNCFLSPMNVKSQELIKESIKDSQDDDDLNLFRYTDEEKSELRKHVLTMTEQCYNDSRASAADLNELRAAMDDVFQTHISKIQSKWGKNGGGEGRIEFYATPQERSKVVGRYRGSY